MIRTQFLPAWELMTVVACIASGTVGLKYVFDSTFWNELNRRNTGRVEVGTLTRFSGSVRSRPDGAIAWLDILKAGSVSVGDSFFTGTDGRVEISLAEGTQVEIEPNSLITIRGAERVAETTGWNFLRRKTSAAAMVQIKKGVSKVKVARGSALKLSAGGKDYQVSGRTEESAAVDIRVMSPMPTGSSTSARAEALEPVVSFDVAPETRLEQTTGGAPAKEVTLPVIRTVTPAGGELIRMPSSSSGDFQAAVQFVWRAPDQGLGALSLELAGDTSAVWEVGVEEAIARRASRPLKTGTYKWRIKDSSGEAASEWTEFRFQEFAAPMMRGPAQGALIRSTRNDSGEVPVRFGWEPLADGAYGEIELTAPGRAPESIRGDSNETVSKLGAGRYSWRIRSVLPVEGGKSLQSAWSSSAEFEVAPAIVANPVTIPVALPSVVPSAVPVPVPVPAPSPVQVVVAKPTPRPADLKAEREQKKAIKEMPADVVKILPRSTDKAVENFAPLASLAVMPVLANTKLQSEDDLDKMKIALRWAPIRGVKTYEVKVGETNGKILSSKQVPEPFLLLTLTSLNRKDYYYQVDAEDESGRRISSGPVPINIEIIPPSPKLPAAGTKIDGAEPVLLTWVSTALTQKYQVEFSEKADFSKIHQNFDVEKNFLLFTPSRPGRWYSRVRAVAGSLKSDWSKQWSFVVTRIAEPSSDSAIGDERMPAR